jgi:hypothetical protein
MKIIIPSKARSDRLHTVRELERSGVIDLYECFIAIPRNEWPEYSNAVPMRIKCLPLDCTGINNVRQHIIEHCTDDKVLMIDDDLTFFHRPLLDHEDLFKANDEDILKAIQWLDVQLDSFAHCSISARTQNFQCTKRLVKAEKFELQTTRPYRIYGFRRDIFLGEGLNFHAGLKINVQDDFHATLCLLELGYPNIVNFEFAQEQRGSNSKGGCSTYREIELLNRCSVNLKSKHPEVVKITKKTTINSWGGTPENPVTRMDVIIQWQKALGIRGTESKL